MESTKIATKLPERKFPKFDLSRLLTSVFAPKKGETLCILIDLDDPAEIKNLAFLKNSKNHVQKKAYEIFYKGLQDGVMQKLQLGKVDFFAYKKTAGSNLELPEKAYKLDGTPVNLVKDIYPNYDIILCIGNNSATAPMTATAKKFGFRGATMHGMNDLILQSGLAVDYNEVSTETEKLRKGMTGADSADIEFEVEHKKYHLHIDLGKQEAQKSHGLCRVAPDIANLPAGEVYFVPRDAKGEFPIKFDDGTLGLMHVDKARVNKVTLIKGDQKVVDEMQHKLDTDPATGVLGELGFGSQVYPYSGSDIQDEKIFGTFHIATGRNDHLNGDVVLKSFKNPLNASHDDILFSSTKTPEIHVIKVQMKRNGKNETLIEHYVPSDYLLNLLK